MKSHNFVSLAFHHHTCKLLNVTKYASGNVPCFAYHLLRRPIKIDEEKNACRLRLSPCQRKGQHYAPFGFMKKKLSQTLPRTLRYSSFHQPDY